MCCCLYCFITKVCAGTVSLSWFLLMRRDSGSTPSSSLVTKLATVSLRVSPAKVRRKTNFGHLNSQPYSFGHVSKLMAIGENWTAGWLVNRELRLATLPSPRQIGLTSASLQPLPQSVCLSPALFNPHLWRPQDSWTPPLEVGLSSWP